MIRREFTCPDCEREGHREPTYLATGRRAAAHLGLTRCGVHRVAERRRRQALSARQRRRKSAPHPASQVSRAVLPALSGLWRAVCGGLVTPGWVAVGSGGSRGRAYAYVAGAQGTPGGGSLRPYVRAHTRGSL